MRTQIQIQDLQTYGYHGIFEEERRLGQKFSFDIEASLAAGGSHRGDDLTASVRYDAVVEEAVRLASEARFHTLEALGEAMAAGLLARFTLMEAVAVNVSKFSPPIPHALQKVGISIQMTRKELPRHS